MEKRSKEEVVFEWLALIGVVTSTVGWFISSWVTSGSIEWIDVVKMLGLAVFFGSIAVNMRLLLKKSDANKSDIQRDVIRIGVENEKGFELAVKTIREEIGRLKDEHAVLSTYRDILDMSFLLDSDDSAIHVRAAGETLRQVVATHLPTSTATLKRFQMGEPQATIEITDHSPIFDLMKRLASGLPTGSVWLGITHLDNVDAWLKPLDQAFKHYQEFTRERSKKGDIRVCRLFCFGATDVDKIGKMRVVMRREARSGILVRSLQSQELPPDISLLYLPPMQGVGEKVSVEFDPHYDLVAMGYRPLCVLSYTLRAGQYVQNLSINAGTSDWFTAMEREFKQAWKIGAVEEFKENLPEE